MLRRVRRRQNNAEPPLDCDGDPRSGEASPTRAQRMRTARGRLRFVALPPAPSTTRGRPWEALPHRTRRGWHVPTRRGATANEPSPSLVLSVPMYYPSRLADKLRGTVANDVASFGKSHRVQPIKWSVRVFCDYADEPITWPYLPFSPSVFHDSKCRIDQNRSSSWYLRTQGVPHGATERSEFPAKVSTLSEGIGQTGNPLLCARELTDYAVWGDS